MKTRKQLNRQLAAKAKARRQAKMARNARWLQANHAWNWVWPDELNRWPTPPVSKGPNPEIALHDVRLIGTHPYSAVGQRRKDSRERRGRRCHKYPRTEVR